MILRDLGEDQIPSDAYALVKGREVGVESFWLNTFPLADPAPRVFQSIDRVGRSASGADDPFTVITFVWSRSAPGCRSCPGPPGRSALSARHDPVPLKSDPSDTSCIPKDYFLFPFQDERKRNDIRPKVPHLPRLHTLWPSSESSALAILRCYLTTSDGRCFIYLDRLGACPSDLEQRSGIDEEMPMEGWPQKGGPHSSELASFADGMVSSGDTVALDESESSLAMAHSLLGVKRLMVVTNGLRVANFIANNSDTTVILLPGRLDRVTQSVFITGNTLPLEPKITFGFFSSAAISDQGTLLEHDEALARTKRALLLKCVRRFAFLNERHVVPEGQLYGVAQRGELHSCLHIRVPAATAKLDALL